MECPSCRQPAEERAPDRLYCKTCKTEMVNENGEWHVVGENQAPPVEPPRQDPDGGGPLPVESGSKDKGTVQLPAGPVADGQGDRPPGKTPESVPASRKRFRIVWYGGER
jgi:hypothetical protein